MLQTLRRGFPSFVSRPRAGQRLGLVPENAEYLSAIAQTVGQGRPAVLLDLVYFAAANLSREDLESLA